MKYGVFVLLAMVLTLTSRTAFAQDSGTITNRRLRITVGDRVLSAVLLDNETARDFLTLLPMTVRASDYISREKYWHLPRPLVAGGGGESEYERGDLGFWIPNSDMALFYNHDGSTLPTPGIIVIARISSGLEIFNRYPGPVALKIEAAD